MKILILTSINPVISSTTYVRIANTLEEKGKKVNFLCFPFFADVDARNNEKQYLPTFFSMLKTSLKPEMKKKLYNKEHLVVIGNTYKEQKFDIIVALDEIEGEVFDSYIETIKQNEDLKEFAELVNVENLYTPADASIFLPTIDHAILFIEESLNEENRPES